MSKWKIKLETSNSFYVMSAESRQQKHGVKMISTSVITSTQCDFQTVCRRGVKISLNVSKVMYFKAGVGKQLPAFL